MPLSLHEMVKAQMHLGHRINRWNPKMKPFIVSTNNNYHILDLIKTYFYTRNVLRFLQVTAGEGKSVLFVGTKKEAKPFISEFALESNSFYINEKWVGGLLTNWKTFKKSTKKLLRLERQEKKGFLDKLPKKEKAKKLKEKDKLTRLFDGIKYMRALPDVVIIIGQREEANAINECRRLGLRTITVLDTNCNPELADYLIPANDDSPAAIKLLLQRFSSAILEGQEFYDTHNPAQSKPDKKGDKKPNKKSDKKPDKKGDKKPDKKGDKKLDKKGDKKLDKKGDKKSDKKGDKDKKNQKGGQNQKRGKNQQNQKRGKNQQNQKGRKGQQNQQNELLQPKKRVQRNKSSIKWRQQKEALKRAQTETPVKPTAPVPDLLERPTWVPPVEPLDA